MSVTQLAVGLVGAGPWARMVHAPTLAAGPETRLAAIWARRPEAARALAEPLGASVAATYDELLDACDAVAFSVPPDVQAELAVAAARAGKPLLLEKPLALTLDPARRLAEAVDAAGVVSQMVLSYRYRAGTRSWLDEARGFGAVGARAAFLSGAILSGGAFSTPWRHAHGALLDVGPHVLDLLDAALGPIAHISGRGDPLRWVALTCVHEGGAVSQAALSITVPNVSIWSCELYGPEGTLTFDGRASEDDVWPTVRREFADAVLTGRPHPLDVHRGLLLQELLDRAARSLA